MVLDNIREQIKVILQGVPGIGVVHDYMRWSNDQQKMLSLFQEAGGRINTVMFAREKTAKKIITIGQNKERVHVFMFRVIMGLKDADATGIIFSNLLDAIEERFDLYPTLNETCRTLQSDWGTMSGVFGMQIELSEERRFGNTLCHYAELRLCVVERNSR